MVCSVGEFDFVLGCKGVKFFGGEEVDLFNCICVVGGVVWYIFEVVVFYKIVNKFCKEYIVDYVYWFGVLEVYMECCF